jgi:hypothetical protein
MKQEMRKTISFTLDKKVIKFIDEEAKKLNISKSRYVENVFLEEIKKKIREGEL